MTNGGINVEIGNPSYNMYEVEHDNHADAGSLLRPNFTLDPHKVCSHTHTLTCNISVQSQGAEPLCFGACVAGEAALIPRLSGV